MASRRGTSAPLRTGGFYGVSSVRGRNELKTIDTGPTTTNVTSTATLTLLNGVATGTDYTNRIGRKIRMRNLYIRYWMAPEDNTCNDNVVRCMIVYDNQTNGAAPNITDILNSSSVVEQLNLNNRDRFKVLWDKLFILGAVSNIATQAFSNGHNTYSGKKFIKLPLKGAMEALFGGTGSTVGSIQTGSIYLVLLAVATAGGSANFQYTTRIRFEDA